MDRLKVTAVTSGRFMSAAVDSGEANNLDNCVGRPP